MQELYDMRVEFEVNGARVAIAATPGTTLLDGLRNQLELTGTKEGCGEGECGACSVILDGRIVNSCLVLAAECRGARITTIEGLSGGAHLHPIQQAFVDNGAIQCGFCSPGMIMAACALLDANPSPDETEVKRALEGNLCRCTGYRKIIDAVLAVAHGGSRDD